MNIQPTLHGKLIELRPLQPADYADLYSVAADPLLWEQHPVKDRHRADVFKAFFDAALASGGALVAVDRQSGRVIGSSRYHGYDAQSRVVEIGWTFLARSHWGGTFNGEMKALMLRHAFAFVDTVIFVIGPQNVRSQRAVEKLGAVRTGERPAPEGGINVVYTITAPQLA